MEDNYYRPQVAVPNSTIILILGIVSIVTCWCYGVIGLICAIVTVVLAAGASRQYKADPAAYTESSYKNVTAGKICAIIGLVLSLLFLLCVIWFIAMIGFGALNDPEALQEWLRNYQH